MDAATLTDAEAEEAARVARIAARAEQKALERKAAAALYQSMGHTISSSASDAVSSSAGPARPVYQTKAEREAAALARLQERRGKGAGEDGGTSAALSTDARAPDRNGGHRDVDAAPASAAGSRYDRYDDLDRRRVDDRRRARDGDDYYSRERDRGRDARRDGGRDTDDYDDRRDRRPDQRDERHDSRRDRRADDAPPRGGAARPLYDRPAAAAPVMTTASTVLPTGVSDSVAGPVYGEDPSIAAERARAAEALKAKYTGHKEVKSKVVKPSEKFVRVYKFEWDASEDTSVGANPLFRDAAAPALLFGRGYQAGIDMREQRKASHYAHALTQRREAEAAAAAASAASRARPASQSSAPAPASSSAMEEETMPDRFTDLPGRHWTLKRLEDMTERDWRIMREDFDILVKGGRAVNPLRKWSEAGIHPLIQRAIDEMGYKEPTAIQRQAIPMGLHGRDLLGVAETGSGKTAAFMIPLLTYVMSQPEAARASVVDNGPLALVMAPTRELAQQIEEECVKLARFTGLRSLSIVGGTGIQEQGARLREGVDIIIGTPGRLIDALEQAYLVLHQCRYIVLDEADRMIDLGFEPQVTAVMDAMASSTSTPAAATGTEEQAASAGVAASGRTTHMFSATMPAEIERLAKKYLSHPAIIKIGDEDSGKNKRIAQEIIFLPSEGKKKSKLLEVLARGERPAIVFCNAKKGCDVIARDLEAAGITTATVLHSGKTQDIREEALASFKAGEFDILIATDVAGRGLDIPDVAHVINFDMSGDIDRYTHRIGRTGRAGKTGKATTFLTEDDMAVIPALKTYLEATGQPVPPDVASRASGEGKRDSVKFARK